MPVSGGAADKLGNRYEALWAIDQLLRIVDGEARSLTLEPLDPVESRGVEFTVATANGTMEYWSVKRQTIRAAGWTLATLAASDDHGRAILRDLLGHVERDATHHAVFASTLGARDFDELRAHAESREFLEARLQQSAEIREAFSHVLRLCDGDTDRALNFLRRTRTHATDEPQLFKRVEFAIRKLLYAADGSTLDVANVRVHLADLLLDRIHRPVDRETILGVLATHGVRLREWSAEKSLQDRVREMRDNYTAPLQKQRINGKLLLLPGSESVLDANDHPVARKTLVVGCAGGGKSTTLAGLVERLRDSGIPVLPLRFDQLSDGILTTTELGRKLLLPESPAITLAGIASGGPCVLFIDQLDAVSIASGRRAELWSLFEELHREAERFPRMSLIVGCREFDLEHDHRLRTIKLKTSGFAVAELGSLSTEQVDSALRDAGIDPAAVQSTLKPVLVLPLHLSMFLSLAVADRIGVRSRDELLDSFWIEGERRVNLRLGQKSAWTQVIDKLANWLSDNQQLSAPRDVLDEFSPDAAAMASEHILVLADSRYRFFHESFFDYAFARRFAARGERLVDLLLKSEQHLFRRGQVRQVLSYLRAQNWTRYLDELGSVLGAKGVRFHIKRLVFQWLSSLKDPRRQEWNVLQKLLGVEPGLQSHVRGLIWGHSGWFDVLDSTGFFDIALASDDHPFQEESVKLLGADAVLRDRSNRIVELLRKHRRSGEPWNRYLRYICQTGKVYHSREMFDFFLSLIDDHTLEGIRPGVAVNDDWWDIFYEMVEKRPDWVCEAIGRWLDRALSAWRSEQSCTEESIQSARVSKYLDRSGDGAQVIYAASNSFVKFVEEILPRIAKFLEESAEKFAGSLDADPLWSCRSFGMEIQTHEALLGALSIALEKLARESPADLDRLLLPYQDTCSDTIAYLVLRAWTAAPSIYADRLADYLAADPRRLSVGYASWEAEGGSAAIYVSTQAVRAASAHCSAERFRSLEQAIISLTDAWEARHPQLRGLKQLELMRSLDGSRLGPIGRARLNELERKFPQVRHDPPQYSSVGWGRSPIPEDAQSKMSDEQWLRAMQKYAGVDLRFGKGARSLGGEQELAHSLEAQTKVEPARFAALASRMPDDLPLTYFRRILWGVADYAREKKEEARPEITFPQVVSLVRRVNTLPNRPCGAEIASLLEKWVNHEWPDDILEALVWYAINDPDPEEELWRKPASTGQAYYGGNPYSAGINSTRGRIAGVIGRLLFEQPERLDQLQDAVVSLAHDLSIAVRTCAVEPLLAVLRVDSPKAISLFIDCVAADPAILETPLVERFIHYAGYRDYGAVRPVIYAMLIATSERAVAAGARQVCLLALDVEEAVSDVERVHSGTSVMRKAAVDVYATNVAHEIVGQVCRKKLKPFFFDPEDSVRAGSASAFKQVANLMTNDQADLLSAFLDAVPGKAALKPVVHALEDSPVMLPDLVCKLAEMCVETYCTEAGDISNASAMIATDLSKIVVRLYAQTEDSAIQSRCLNLIDEMERYHFMGLTKELQRLDR